MAAETVEARELALATDVSTVVSNVQTILPEATLLRSDET